MQTNTSFVASKPCNSTELSSSFVDDRYKKSISDLLLPNQSSCSLINLLETKSYIPFSSCVLEHILTLTTLSPLEKLYYLLADSLALINKSQGGHRSIALSSEAWGLRLNCSRSKIFAMQKKLEEKGYFIINKDWDKIGRNKRNLIIPTLPTSVFYHLDTKYPNKEKEANIYNPAIECIRAYLDRNKLFIKVNYDLLKNITSNPDLSSKQKIIWLGFYTRCYKNYMLKISKESREQSGSNEFKHNTDLSFRFISSYKELAKVYSLDSKNLSKSIKVLESLGFIKMQQFYTRNKLSEGGIYSNDFNCSEAQERQDQSLWKITLLLPSNQFLDLQKLQNRSSLILDKIKEDPSKIVDDNTEDSINTSKTTLDDYLMLGGIKLNLNSDQISLLQSALTQNKTNNFTSPTKANIPFVSSSLAFASESENPEEKYIDSIIDELKLLESDEQNIEDLDKLDQGQLKVKESMNLISDPSFAKTRLLLNKYIKTKRSVKSNLEATPEVFLNEFSRKKEKRFNIASQFIRQCLRELPQEKAEKARKFAYALVSKKLAKGYAAELNKHELAKQLIHHAATWKPTKLGILTKDEQIDAALATAWRAIVQGTWKAPLEWEKAKGLDFEFNCYIRKYKIDGVLSSDINSLEFTVGKLLKNEFIDLRSKIIEHGRDEVEETEDFKKLTDRNLIPIDQNIELPSFPEDRELYISYNNTDHTGHMGYNDMGGIDYIEEKDIEDIKFIENTEENNESKIFDLSHIPEEKKYLKITCSAQDNTMIVKTVDNNEYLFKLKAIETKESGETALILDKVKIESFVQDLNIGLLNREGKGGVPVLSDGRNSVLIN